MTESIRHKWDYDSEKRIAACDSESGCDQNEKPCCQCRIVKITIHRPDGQYVRAWRHPNNATQFVCSNTPPCVSIGETIAIR